MSTPPPPVRKGAPFLVPKKRIVPGTTTVWVDTPNGYHCPIPVNNGTEDYSWLGRPQGTQSLKTLPILYYPENMAWADTGQEPAGYAANSDWNHLPVWAPTDPQPLRVPRAVITGGRYAAGDYWDTIEGAAAPLADALQGASINWFNNPFERPNKFPPYPLPVPPIAVAWPRLPLLTLDEVYEPEPDGTYWGWQVDPSAHAAGEVLQIVGVWTDDDAAGAYTDVYISSYTQELLQLPPGTPEYYNQDTTTDSMTETHIWRFGIPNPGDPTWPYMKQVTVMSWIHLPNLMDHDADLIKAWAARCARFRLVILLGRMPHFPDPPFGPYDHSPVLMGSLDQFVAKLTGADPPVDAYWVNLGVAPSDSSVQQAIRDEITDFYPDVEP